MQVVDNKSQANMARMEHQILHHVKQALQVTLDWKVPSVGRTRKLSSVQFTLQSFQRHLERLMDWEEQDGYMAWVVEMKPNMVFRVERLERDHAKFRSVMRDLVPVVEALSEYQDEAFEDICGEISCFLEQIDRHDSEEISLLQEAILMDEGGEG